MNFNEKKSIPIHTKSLKELKEFLSTLPEEYNDWVVSCCGNTDFWVHLRSEEQAINIDTEEQID